MKREIKIYMLKLKKITGIPIVEMFRDDDVIKELRAQAEERAGEEK